METTLTRDDANLLACYISMTTTYRKEQAEGWESLAKEKNPDGTVKFKNAAGNAEYMRNLESRLEAIKEKLDMI